MLNWINDVGHWINGFWAATKFWWHGGAKEIESLVTVGKAAITWIVTGYFAFKIIAAVAKKAKAQKGGSR